MNTSAIDDIYPLSPLQEGFLFESLHSPNSQAYFVQMTFRFSGNFNQELFTKSWQVLSARHAILRTAFVHEDQARPLQVALKERPPEIQAVDFRRMTADEQRQGLHAFQIQDRERGFDLQRDVLVRIAVFRFSEETHYFVLSYPHILLDGWCLGILSREFLHIYSALLRRNVPQLPPAAPYRQYIRWLEAQNRDAARAYWARYLAGCSEQTGIPKFRVSEATGYQAKHVTRELSRQMTAELKTLAQTLGVTLNTVFQGVWGLLLSRYARTTDVVFGIVVSGRPAELYGVEEMVGLFINTLPLRIAYPGERSLAEVLRAIQRDFLDSQPYHHLPLAEIQAQGRQGHALFDHVLIFENYPVGEAFREEGAQSAAEFAVQLTDAHDRTHYDLDFMVAPGEQLRFVFTYNANVYQDAQIHDLAEQVETVIQTLLEQPDSPVGTCLVLSERQQYYQVCELNDTAADFPRDQTVIDLFDAQVVRTPEATAVVFRDTRLTYREIHAWAERIARYLIAVHDIHPEDRIGLLLERSEWMVIGAYGVMKSGAAYVPIDAQYPPDRVRYMLEDSACQLILTIGSPACLAEATQGLSIPVIDMQRIPECEAVADPVHTLSPHNLAYVIYTSGTTGTPKGVMVEHRMLVNLAHSYYHAYGLRDFDVRVLQLASLSFDVFASEILQALTVGGELIICPTESLVDPEALARLIARHCVTIIGSTPALLIPLMEYIYDQHVNISFLKLLLIGADTLAVEHYLTLRRRFGAHTRIVNAYGITETTIDTSFFEQTASNEILSQNMPIARPILSNMECYVLDNRFSPLPLGVPGKLYIGGAGVARGYVNRPDLTAERFLPHPFKPGERLYDTGDLARWLPDGNLEFLGRSDDQIKVRGYRVEPGEIENRLLRHPSVRNAIVTVKTIQGVNELAAFIEPQGVWNVTDLRDHLKSMLPEYMIPAYFVKVAHFALTPNGKIDRGALPEPDIANMERATRYVAPRSEVEEQLVHIWQNVLQAERIGVYDNFFESGGHSLKAMQIASRIHKIFGVKLNLAAFFADPTIASLAALLDLTQKQAYMNIESAPLQEHYELSHAQKRLWMLHYMGGETAYNMPDAIRFSGALDMEALRKALATLVARHETLRTAFVEVNGEPRQKIAAELTVSITEVDFSGAEDAEALAKEYVERDAVTAFDLTTPPLFRVSVLMLAPKAGVFVITMHHIIGDGWSGNVFFRELTALYSAYRQGRPNPLPPLRIQYKDFAVWQNQRNFEADERYWLEKLAGMPERIALQYDFPSPESRDFQGNSCETMVPAELTQALRDRATARNTTLSNVVLSIFTLFLFHLTKQNDLCIGVGAANRYHPDLEPLIGFFVNMLPVRVQVSADMEFDDLLDQIVTATYGAFEHQEYPFDLLIHVVNPAREANRQPLVNVVYGFQNFADVNVEIGDEHMQWTAVGNDDGGNVDIKEFGMRFETSKFDLTLFVVESGDELRLLLEYDSALFRQDTIQQYLRILTRFVHLLASEG